MDECVTSIGMPCDGYVVVDEGGRQIELPYAEGEAGYSFHFGDLVYNLRRHVWNECRTAVTMLEATVTEVLVERVAPCVDRAYGVAYVMRNGANVPELPFADVSTARTESVDAGADVYCVATAPLIVMCDGGSSKFKALHQHYTPAANYHSHFVGLIVRNARLPLERHGTVFFGKNGPILSYRLDPNELRFLVDYNKAALPSLEEQSRWLTDEIAPCLPADMRPEFIKAAQTVLNIRSMPIACYPAAFPSIMGYVGIGDHANQRHPLTGGGMTCAFNDALLLAAKLSAIGDLRATNVATMSKIQGKLQEAIISYARARVAHSASINILSWALYDVFCAPLLRNACLDYFLRGGEAVSVPMALLSGLDSRPQQLLWHYALVMLRGAQSLVTRGGRYGNRDKADSFTSNRVNTAKFRVAPSHIYEVFQLLFSAVLVAVPVSYNEFVSLWRLVDPTGFLAFIFKTARVASYRLSARGVNGKPVGL
ncbi:unnamed protein product [Trypanosoma congolense IL3000]|uniref:Squalene monooxygenase n=1 Tax=Trypanosoma congolense (strain IL3000) TaxID=1068625 RepID=F9WDK9_TRYCI|nr:unnamed protein product [Trypanosoma congolense IL3000]